MDIIDAVLGAAIAGGGGGSVDAYTKAETNQLLSSKVDKQQSVGDAGKVLGIDNTGAVVPVTGGGILPILIVSAATGSTVTISRGGTTLTATEVSGTWTFNPTSLGTWTITCVNGETTVTQTIEIATVKEYRTQVFLSPVFGIKRQLTASSPAWERTDDAVGFTFTPTVGSDVGSSSFDAYAPWKDIQRVNIGTDVMVEIPNFYVKRYQEAGYEHIKVCATPATGFVPAVSYSDGVPDKFYVGAYKTVTGHASKSGYNPLVSLTRDQFRTAARAKGTGWGLIDVQAAFAVNILMLVEIASYDSQSVIARGYCDGNSGSLITGTCDGIVTGRPGGTNGKTDVVYRYIEGWWGNVWEWFDGLNVNNGAYYVSNNRAAYADDTSAQYTQLSFGATVGWDSAYQKIHGKDEGYQTLLLPKEIGGSETTFVCDSCSCQNDWCVARRGGSWYSDSYSGAFTLHVNSASSATYMYSGSRLLYLAP